MSKTILIGLMLCALILVSGCSKFNPETDTCILRCADSSLETPHYDCWENGKPLPNKCIAWEKKVAVKINQTTPQKPIEGIELYKYISTQNVTIGNKTYMADPHLRHDIEYQKLVNQVYGGTVYRDGNNFSILNCNDTWRGEELCKEYEQEFEETRCISPEFTGRICCQESFLFPFIPQCHELPLWKYVNETRWTHFPEKYLEVEE